MAAYIAELAPVPANDRAIAAALTHARDVIWEADKPRGPPGRSAHAVADLIDEHFLMRQTQPAVKKVG